MHFVRVNANGTFGVCGHMVNAQSFETFTEFESSEWRKTLIAKFESGHWPLECVRCAHSEQVGEKSIRQHFIDYDTRQTIPNYLVVGGVLDNVCNSACQTCTSELSTKIGSLENKKTFLISNNKKAFYEIPQDRIVKLDINGGEPSVSKNYKELLSNLPSNVKEIRINTNGGKVINEIKTLIQKRISVTVTVSLDGVDMVHDYVRWPIPWGKLKKNLLIYKSMRGIKLNTWTTLSALNIGNFFKIQKFCSEHELKHSFALLAIPEVLNIHYKNKLTLAAKEQFVGHELYNCIAVGPDNNDILIEFIKKQDHLRGIAINNFIESWETI